MRTSVIPAWAFFLAPLALAGAPADMKYCSSELADFQSGPRSNSLSRAVSGNYHFDESGKLVVESSSANRLFGPSSTTYSSTPTSFSASQRGRHVTRDFSVSQVSEIPLTYEISTKDDDVSGNGNYYSVRFTYFNGICIPLSISQGNTATGTTCDLTEDYRDGKGLHVSACLTKEKTDDPRLKPFFAGLAAKAKGAASRVEGETKSTGVTAPAN